MDNGFGSFLIDVTVLVIVILGCLVFANYSADPVAAVAALTGYFGYFLGASALIYKYGSQNRSK